MRGRMMAIVAAALLSLPVTAMPASAGEQDMERFYDERMAELRGMWEGPSNLDALGAAELLERAAASSLTEDEAVALARFLAEEAAAPDVAAEALRIWYAGVLRTGTQTWQQGTWDDLAVPLTVAYLAAGAVNPTFLPHNLRIPGIYIGFDTAAGCSGGWSEGMCYLRITTDLLGLVALDLHQTTDTAVVQLPLSLEFHVHWALSCGWTGCSIRITLHVHLPDTVVASNAAYVFAFPAMSGAIATRATDNEVLQVIYDRLGGINWMKPRQVTSAALLGGTPAEAKLRETQLGGSPGLGDLHAVAPAPTYYGLQVPPEAPAKPGLPGAPAQPPAGPAADLAAQLAAAYGSVRTRVRDDFGTAPIDSTGPTVVFEMSQIRAWSLNVGIVRWKNVGTGTLGAAPTSPASFYYDAAWSLTGGEPNTWTKDYSIRDPLA